ncbi:MAG: hypothetical protein ACFFFB_17420 [Candidatus Heimdallarchaeota archaeon]
MPENQNKDEDKLEEEEGKPKKDDLEVYFSEMENLESDFSDLDDIDLEELKDIQQAISKVKEMASTSANEITDLDIVEELKTQPEADSGQLDEYLSQREAMASDFSDLEEIPFEELQDMREAIESVKKEQTEEASETKDQSVSIISSDLEERIKQELLERRIKEEKEVVTAEKFLDYIKEKKDKVWYHALHYLVFQAEDHIASKELLYDILKENTSKSPIDPIPEHQFYFGLGYILRLTLNEKQVVRFLSGGKFKVNIGVKVLKELLEQAGEPIITKPVIEEEEKKKIFSDFLKEDFKDI